MVPLATPSRFCLTYEQLTEAIADLCRTVNRTINRSHCRPIYISWDVNFMYPSINNEMGISACKGALDKRTTLSPSTECLLEAIKITLDCNSSSFNNKHYRQNRGTAMGLLTMLVVMLI